MSASRLKMELGTRDDDTRDDRPRGGFLHRTPREFRVHPTHPVDHICTYPDDSCHATVARNERDGHRDWHRRHAEWDAEWQDLVERQAAVIEHLEARVSTLEAQHEYIARVHGHAMAPLLGEADPA